MREGQYTLDNAPITPFHRKLSFLVCGGPFCDGYILGILVIALPMMQQELALTSIETALLGASSLVGIFAGGLLFGPITDKYGRRVLYILNLLAFVVISLLQLFVQDAYWLILLRFLLGVAVGADYPIASALAAEFLPMKLRGPSLSAMVLMFWAGYLVSTFMGPLFSALGSDYWQYALASGAIPSFICLVLRFNIPESPRWLISAGKHDDAHHVVRHYLGDHIDFKHLISSTPRHMFRSKLGLDNFKSLIKAGYGKAIIFCSIFWVCQVAPSFAIKTFQPMLLEAFHIQNIFWGTILIMSFAVFGTIMGMLVINRLGRRKLLILTFIISTLSLLTLSTPISNVASIAVMMFIMFTFFEAAGSSLQFVYPNELFPTAFRGTGMGISLAASRIGAAGGTFLLPIITSYSGVTGGLLVASVISFIGLVTSFIMAPETGEQMSPEGIVTNT